MHIQAYPATRCHIPARIDRGLDDVSQVDRPQPERDIPLQAVDERCVRCSYGMAWIVIRSRLFETFLQCREVNLSIFMMPAFPSQRLAVRAGR